MREQLYNIGDKVRIIENPQSTDQCNFAPEMEFWAGRVMTIRDIDIECDHFIYWMEEDSDVRVNHKCGWMWVEDWIEGLAYEEDIPEQDILTML